MTLTMKLLKPLFAAVALSSTAAFVASPPAAAQDLEVTVTPGQRGVTDLGRTPGGWMMVPVQNLYTLGPNYSQRSGTRVRPGSQIPDWIDTAQFQSISIPRLQPNGYYVYFVSPDRKLVVMDPETRRVVHVIR